MFTYCGRSLLLDSITRCSAASCTIVYLPGWSLVLVSMTRYCTIIHVLRSLLVIGLHNKKLHMLYNCLFTWSILAIGLHKRYCTIIHVLRSILVIGLHNKMRAYFGRFLVRCKFEECGWLYTVYTFLFNFLVYSYFRDLFLSRNINCIIPNNWIW